jgi:4-aminobutyrate aminotransferase-like enzyme
LGLNAKASFRRGLGVPPGAHFFPFPYAYRCPFGNRHDDPDDCARECLAFLERALHDPASGLGEVAAVMVEPVQGNGGVVVSPPSFLPGLRRLCDEFGILLIFDEIQSGFGRTGRLWASEHWNVVPDLMTVGKGVGGGMAVSAVLGREGPMGALDPGQHTSTFLTNALTHAAAIAAIDVLIEEDLCRRSGALGEVLLSSLRVRLADHPHVGDVRGLGLFVGVELVADRKTREPAAKLAAEIQNRARNAGLIVGLSGYHNNVIKLAPPLVISREQIEIALSLLGEVLSDD